MPVTIDTVAVFGNCVDWESHIIGYTVANKTPLSRAWIDCELQTFHNTHNHLSDREYFNAFKQFLENAGLAFSKSKLDIKYQLKRMYDKVIAINPNTIDPRLLVLYIGFGVNQDDVYWVQHTDELTPNQTYPTVPVQEMVRIMMNTNNKLTEHLRTVCMLWRSLGYKARHNTLEIDGAHSSNIEFTAPNDEFDYIFVEPMPTPQQPDIEFDTPDDEFDHIFVKPMLLPPE